MAAFYIYIDAGDDLVASGSEDSIGRVWDRSVQKYHNSVPVTYERQADGPTKRLYILENQCIIVFFFKVKFPSS